MIQAKKTIDEFPAVLIATLAIYEARFGARGLKTERPYRTLSRLRFAEAGSDRHCARAHLYVLRHLKHAILGG